MKAVICWPYISGYMAACWRALAARGDVEFSLLAYKSDVPGEMFSFGDDLVRDLPCRLLAPQEQEDHAVVRSVVREQNPDIIVLSGWNNAAYRGLVQDALLREKKFVMTMDTPYRGTLRQRLARLKIGRYLDRIDRVIVPGERAWQLARALRIPEAKLRRGMYGIDYQRLAPTLQQRRSHSDGWPKRFLFMGRYHEEKGLDILRDAYRAYRQSVDRPWELTCCGSGPLAGLLRGEAGVMDHGFVDPVDVPQIMAEHGVLVLPSRLDPWPLVIVEACAAGLPVIHSHACGSGVELVRSCFNGMSVATGRVDSLAMAMRWCHANYDKVPEMGARAQPLAAAYSAEVWAERWMQTFQELCDG